MPSKTFERLYVVGVPFPFTDKASSKRRPAVVLSGDASFNRASKHAVLAIVTSATERAWPLDVQIADLGSAGLSVPCSVRFKLFTLDERLIVRKAGALAAKDRKAVTEATRSLFLA